MPTPLAHRSFYKQKIQVESGVINNERPFIEINIKHMGNTENQNEINAGKEDITFKVSIRRL